MKDGVPERKANRLATYNYSQSGVYFITICSKNKRCTFGTIVGGGVPDAPRTRLSPTGKIVARQLGNMIVFYPHVRIEKYVVMPNHIHLLIANSHRHHLKNQASYPNLILWLLKIR